MDVQSLLGELGYEPYSVTWRSYFASTMDNIFENFSDIEKKRLLEYFNTKEPSPAYPFLFYDLVINALVEVFGIKQARMIEDKIRDLIKKRLHFKGETSLNDMIKEIQKKEVFEFLKNLKGHEHFLYLWSSEETRNEIMKTFFSFAESTTGFISSQPELMSNVGTISYSELLQKENPVSTEFGLIVETDSKNKLKEPSRVAGDDCTRWFDHGLTREFLDLERNLDEYFSKNNVSCICGYNLSKIQDKELGKKLLDNHGFVIMDDPFEIYKKVI